MNKNIKALAAAKAKKNNGGRQVPLDYISEYGNGQTGGYDINYSGKNATFYPGKNKLRNFPGGDQEGPIRAAKDYVGNGKLGRRVTFRRSVQERYAPMYRNRH